MSKLLEDEAINPSYYRGDVEAIDAIKAATGPKFEGYLQGAAMKYLWRYRHKGEMEDLNKCKWYLNRLIQELTNDSQTFRP